MKKKGIISIVFLAVLFIGSATASANSPGKKEKGTKKEKRKGTFRDSLDNAFDVSNWMSQLGGFLPLPSIITEPAVGYGLMMNMVFFHPTKESVDKNAEQSKQLSLPSMTVAGGVYTE